MNTIPNRFCAAAVLALAGAALGQVTPGAFTPDACEDYEGTPGGRATLSSLFGGSVPVIPGSVTHNSVDFGNWQDFRSPGGPIQPCSGTKFGVGFGFGDFTLDFSGIGGITGFSFCASAAGVGSDSIEFFDLAGNPMTGTYVDPDGFGPGDGTMEQFSFVSCVPIGSIRLTGRETAYDDLCYSQQACPTDAATLSIRCGLCDCFDLPEDPSTPRPELVSFGASINPNPGPVNFDGTVRNRWFAQSFVGLPKGCIIGGTLTITVRPLPGDGTNDSFWMGQVDGPSTSLATHFTGRRYGDGSGGAQPVLFPGQPWTSAARPDPCGYTVVIDLNTPVGGGPDTLVDRMNALGVLDIFAEDDTAFDCMVLDLQLEPGCDPCPPNPCPADFDGDGVLTIFDFLAFQNAFVRGCP